MNDRYLPALIMLIAGAITSIMSIVKGLDVLYSLKILLGVLILFYIIGLLARRMFRKVKTMYRKQTLVEEEEEKEEEKEVNADEEDKQEDFDA